MEDPKKLVSIKDLNPDFSPLTKEKLRELSGLHDLSDEQAEEAVRSIRKLAKILFLFSSEMNGNAISQNNDNEELKSKVA